MVARVIVAFIVDGTIYPAGKLSQATANASEKVSVVVAPVTAQYVAVMVSAAISKTVFSRIRRAGMLQGATVFKVDPKSVRVTRTVVATTRGHVKAVELLGARIGGELRPAAPVGVYTTGRATLAVARPWAATAPRCTACFGDWRWGGRCHRCIVAGLE